MTAHPPSVGGRASARRHEGREERTGEPALFVVWSNGRHREERIVTDLARRFQLLRLWEVTWTSGRLMQNYRRFYNDLPVRGVYHTHGKGTGPFLAAVVLDPEPCVAERMTSRGRRIVNTRFLDAKTEYRGWAGELTIHCTETPFETERDLTMLFGVDARRLERYVGDPRPDVVERVERDLTGSEGWNSEGELFEVLNRSVSYVVTGAPGARPDDRLLGSPEVNLLTDDYLTLHAVLGARPRTPWPNGGPFQVRVSGRWVDVALRFVGDGFYPPGLAERLLASRTSDAGGRFRPARGDDFRALVYDRYAHGPNPRGRTPPLTELATDLGIVEWPTEAPDSGPPAVWIQGWLASDGLGSVEPRDPSVHFDPSFGTARSARSSAPLARRLSWWRLRARRATQDWLWGARDQLLFRAPAVRRIKQLPARLRGRVRSVLRRPVFHVFKRAVLLGRGLLFVGRRYTCPCCGWSLRGFTGPWSLLASNSDGYCPRCNAKARHRRLWLFLREKTDLLAADATRLLEVAPWWGVSRRLMRAPNVSFIGLDLQRTGPHVTLVGDAARIPLESGSVDSALCVHTLEHIGDDRAAMRELHRVLRPGGWAVVSVPLDLDAETFEDPTITDPEERLRAFGERSHVRAYGLDIGDRLTAAGFSVQLDRAADIPAEVRQRFGLRDDENIFFCRKAPGPG